MNQLMKKVFDLFTTKFLHDLLQLDFQNRNGWYDTTPLLSKIDTPYMMGRPIKVNAAALVIVRAMSGSKHIPPSIITMSWSRYLVLIFIKDFMIDWPASS